MASASNFLQQRIFDGYPLWRFFRQPALGLVVLFVLWLVVRAWRKERWKRNMWNTVETENHSFLAWSAEVSDRVRKRQLPKPKTPGVWLVEPPRQLEMKAPAPVIDVATRTAVAGPKSATKAAPIQPPVTASPVRKPVVVQTTIPIAPAAPAKPKPVFVWDESRGID